MSKLVFVRHGQSDGNANGYIAKLDTKLTELGISQAKDTAQKIKPRNIDKIACSPMIRAQQTAEAIAAELGIEVSKIEIIPDLRERGLGKSEGKPKDHDSEWYLTNNETELGIESRHDLIERMDRCLLQLAKISQNSNLLVVGHAISGYYLVEVAEGKTKFEDFRPAKELLNADYIEVDLSHHILKIA